MAGGLLCKPHALAIPHGLQEVLKAYLTGRVFSVRVGAARSSPCYLTGGVPQGSLLPPLLFLLYTSDIPLPVRLHKQVAIYANDTMIFFFLQVTRFTMSALTTLISRRLLAGVVSGTSPLKQQRARRF
ncbi:hypothetical protein Zmor_027095 [Zophobas morio]|jgi:hypothetical protein|uniref:Reverse transcriptase domain-containing protein n=1 Tax=Zophobas morio TaxID=2755281 RepID=A0AA38HJN7_9CUCU|nr:hypothetical protein Zmor_027095 [Zophobas morio]